MAQRRKKLTQPEPGDLSDVGAASDTDGALSMADEMDSPDDEAAVSRVPHPWQLLQLIALGDPVLG